MSVDFDTLPAPRVRRLSLLFLLLLSLGLNAVALDWGLPAGRSTWSFDELPPSSPGHTAMQRHGGRYPPLHYDLLRTLYSPLRHLSGDAADTTTRLYLAGRWVSVLMGVATVALVYRLGLHLLGGAGSALLAALITALGVPFVRYAKTINLDVPYLFWFVLSLLALVRVLDRHRWRDYLAMALAMAAAIGTKDQAAGLYLALPLVLLPSLHAHRQQTGRASPLRTLFDARPWVCLALALVAFALIHRLVSDPDQFRTHVEVLLGKGSQGRADYVASASGLGSMVIAGLRHISYALGTPFFACALAGVALALRERRWRLLALLLLVAVYFAAFMLPLRYLRLRFFLPFAPILALFAAHALTSWLRWGRVSLPLRLLPVALLLLYGLTRPICLNAQMLLDSRYRVEEWLAAHVSADERWVPVGDNAERNVRGGALLPWRRLQTNGDRYLLRTAPDYLVVNVGEAAHARANDVVGALASGRWGYVEVLRHHSQPCCGWIDWSHLSTNLVTVNPPMAVFRRIPPSSPDARLAGLIGALRPGEDSEAWRRVADLVVETPNLEYRRALDRRTAAFAIHGHGWTRGTQPATLVLENTSDRGEGVRLVLRYGAPEGSAVQRVAVLTHRREQRVEIGPSSSSVVRLAPLEPGERRAVLVIAEREWHSGSDPRTLGVRLAVRYGMETDAGGRGLSPRRRGSRRP